jgi:hypothetical protein
MGGTNNNIHECIRRQITLTHILMLHKKVHILIVQALAHSLFHVHTHAHPSLSHTHK